MSEIKVLHNCLVSVKYRTPYRLIQQCVGAIVNLKITKADAWRGDCIEVHFNPAMLRKYLAGCNIGIMVRQVDIETFRIWRTK